MYAGISAACTFFPQNMIFRNGSICVNTINRNSTIKDHDARECWICAMKAVPGNKRFHQMCRLTASDHARAHAMSFSSRFSSALSAISKL